MSEQPQESQISAKVLEDQRDEARFRANILARALGGDRIYPIAPAYRDLWERLKWALMCSSANWTDDRTWRLKVEPLVPGDGEAGGSANADTGHESGG